MEKFVCLIVFVGFAGIALGQVKNVFGNISDKHIYKYIFSKDVEHKTSMNVVIKMRDIFGF